MNGPIVYADITFLVNFGMDFFILWATARLAGIPVVYSRLVVASLLGGIYAVGYLMPGLSGYYIIPMKVLFSCLLVVLGLWPRNWDGFKKAVLYFYGISFMVAGASIATSYFFYNHTAPISFSYLWLLGGILCALLIGWCGEKLLAKKIIPNLLKYPVRLCFNEKSCTGQGFVDTGNGLRDPLTDRPVVVAEYGLIKACLPQDFQQVFEGISNEGEMLDGLSRCSWANRLRLIPFSSIGKRNGLLIGVRADEIVVGSGKKRSSHPNAVVGIYKESLSTEGSYQLLIPSEMVQKT